jgi:ubiquinone/menaquinone biosynthesis C-methylase UbiE
MGMVSAMLPELRARWDAGARHIEFGCGAGGSLLGFAAAHPRLTAVGVEINGAILPETRRRAEAIGVADRVELRQGDALDGAEVAAYDSALWAQQFFAAAGRPAMLAALRRTLKPGGFLIVPTFVPSEPPASDAALHTPAGQAYALSRMRFGRWGIPALTTDELRAEAEAAGFIYLTRAPFSTFFLLLFQRPA